MLPRNVPIISKVAVRVVADMSKQFAHTVRLITGVMKLPIIRIVQRLLSAVAHVIFANRDIILMQAALVKSRT